jgi:hypothetical protein
VPLANLQQHGNERTTIMARALRRYDPDDVIAASVAATSVRLHGL